MPTKGVVHEFEEAQGNEYTVGAGIPCPVVQEHKGLSLDEANALFLNFFTGNMLNSEWTICVMCNQRSQCPQEQLQPQSGAGRDALRVGKMCDCALHIRRYLGARTRLIRALYNDISVLPLEVLHYRSCLQLPSRVDLEALGNLG